MQKRELTPQIKRNKQKFIKKVKDTNDYLYIEGYISANEKCKIKHLSCGNVFSMKPSKFSYGQRCPKCLRPNYNRSHEDFFEQFMEVANGEYEVLGRFTRTDEKTLIKHKICGHKYEVSPHKFVNGNRRCPKCANNIKKTNEEFLKELASLVGDEYKALSQYNGGKRHVKMKHKKCGHRWNVTPVNFLHGNRRCPLCNRSKGELSIESILKNNNLDFKNEFEFADLKGTKGFPLRFDFAIFDNNKHIVKLIEYDGEFHYREMYKDQNFATLLSHDKMKNQYCKDNNISLLRIPYWDFDNIEKILNRELLNF